MGTHTATPAASKRAAQARNRALTREADAILRHADLMETRSHGYVKLTAGSMSGRHEAYGSLVVSDPGDAAPVAMFLPDTRRMFRA